MVSGSVSLPSSGCFSPFPHGTGTLSVSREYLALPDGPGGFAQDYSCPALLRIPLGHATLRVRGSHPLRPDFPDSSARVLCAMAWSYYPDAALLQRRFGLFPGRSPLLGESLLFSLPRGTKMFQFPRFASSHTMMMTVLQTAGLSHSEIRGSKVICTLPRLIAAYHVLHRLREPRHPPCALIHFLGRCRRNNGGISYFQLCPAKSGNTSFLSFTLQFRVSICQRSLFLLLKEIVENIGLEPMTSCMPCKRSSQLS